MVSTSIQRYWALLVSLRSDFSWLVTVSISWKRRRRSLWRSSRWGINSMIRAAQHLEPSPVSPFWYQREYTDEDLGYCNVKRLQNYVLKWKTFLLKLSKNNVKILDVSEFGTRYPSSQESTSCYLNWWIPEHYDSLHLDLVSSKVAERWEIDIWIPHSWCPLYYTTL